VTRSPRSDARRNRQLLLDAARDAFRANGVNVALESVAADAGVSIGTLYNHFKNRDGLVEAVLEPDFRRLCQVADDAAGRTDPWEAFELLVVGICELQAADHAMADIMGLRYPATGVLLDAGQHVTRQFARVIERAKDARCIREDFDMADLGPIIWSNARIAEIAPDDASIWRRHLTFMLDGLRR
jgi:AcrR family transcriptional regulator